MRPKPPSTSWLERAIDYVAPRWALRRTRARMAADALRHYEAASDGRRTQGWRRSSGDANQALGSALANLREHSRDLVRNNPHAAQAVRTIANQVVGWGIVAKPEPANKAAADVWYAWAGSKACDSDGRHDFYGLQKLVQRTVVESGECLVRRRFRRPEDGLPLPLQLQILEPDYIDTAKTGIVLQGGGKIVQGVEFDAIGRRAAYWLFPEHPGAETFGGAQASVRIRAENVLHVFHQERAGQVRAASWLAQIILKLKDWDEYDDAQLMKQKIAACLAVITSDVDGSAGPLGSADSSTSPEIDSIEPGMIHNAPPGRTITVVDPPRIGEFAPYAEVTLRTIAAGIGVTYEDLTGDYTDLPFSAARMSRLAHYQRIDDWRWRTLVPQFCDPVWSWAMQVAVIMGVVREVPRAEWTAPPMPMVEPDKEGLAYNRNIRSGLMSLSEALRERGYDPRATLNELAKDFALLDDLKLILDCDPRNTTQQGLQREASNSTPPGGGQNETPAPKLAPKRPNGEAANA